MKRFSLVFLVAILLHISPVFSVEDTAPSTSARVPLTSIKQAVIQKDNDEVARLISFEASQSELDKGLAAAAGIDNLEAAVLLLKAGANPNKHVGLGHTAVVIAAIEGSTSVLKIMLNHGGDPNARTMFDWRPLHHAMKASSSRTDVMRVLLENDAEVDARTNLQITPLHRAAGFGHVDAVKLLLQYGADRTLKDKYGQTAYDRARKNQHVPAMHLLE